MIRSVARLAALLGPLRDAAGAHPDRFALLFLALLALALRLAFVFRAPVFVVHDSITYFEAGFDFARSGSFELAFKRTPLYPLFVAAVVAGVGEDPHALAFVQHLLGVATVVLTYLLGRELFGRAAGFVAGLLVALAGPLILFEQYILAEALFVPLLLGFALCLARGAGRTATGPRVRWLLAAGLLLGAAGLVRPVGQAAAVVVPLVLLLAWRSWRHAALGTLLVAVGLALALLPWMARNYLQDGSFESAGAVGQTLTGRIIRHDEGFVIPDPNSPSPYADPERTEARALILRQMQRNARPSAINHRLRNTFGWTEAQANRVMRDTALEIIAAQRERYVVGTIAKLRRILWGEVEVYQTHWNARKSEELKEDWKQDPALAHLFDDPTERERAEQPNAAAILNVLQPASWRGPLLALLAAGLVAGLRPRRRAGAVLLVGVILSLVVPAAMLVGYVPRYRYPADPLLAVLVGAGVVALSALAGWAWRRVVRRPSDQVTGEREPDEPPSQTSLPEPAR